MEPIKVKNQYGHYIYGTPYNLIVAAVNSGCMELEIEGYQVEIERIESDKISVVIIVNVQGL